ncbi:hypothetical protein BC829DRAFT_132664 [Chytridium lagenaria]|nr:hypothetical protein BC829DRAFT_132664 [Chytridium lagenaria]
MCSIDAGWGEIMQLEGSVRVHLSKHLKDPKINVEFFGESETLWSGERIRDPSDKKPSSFGPRRLIKRTIYVSPSPLMMPSNVNRFLLLPFSISLPEVGLPPTFSDFRGSITYGIRATISYVEGMRIIRTNKTVEVPVIVAMPIVVRKSLVVNQNHLLYQEPYNPEKVMYTLSVPRRAVCIGESVDLQIQVLNMPPGRSVSSVMVALNTMFEFRGKASVPVSLPPLSKVFDDSWELDHREMMTSNKLPNWKRSYSLLANIEKAKPTLDSPLISVKHFLRLEIRLVGQMYPNVSVEIPIVLVPPWEEPRKLSLAPIDDAAGKEQANASADTSLGPGPRQALTSDSANAAQGTSTETLPSPVAKIDAIPLNGGKSLQIIMPNQSLVCTDYDPLMPDELELRVGDIIVLNMVHDDGWAHGTNLTTNESGMLPLAVLNRDETIPLPSSSAPMAATAQDDAQSDAFSFTHTVIELVGPPKPPQQNRFHKYMEKSNGQGIISPSSQAPVSTSSPSVGLPTDPISGIKSYFGPVTASPSMRTINGRAAPAPFSDDDDLSVVGGNGGRPPVSSNLSYQPSITPNPEVVNGRFGSVSVDPRNNLNAGSAPHPSWTQSPTVDPIVPTYAEPSIAAPKPQSSAAPPSSLVQPPYASPISSQSPIFRSITPPGPNSQRVSPISQIPGAQSSFNPPMYATSHNYQHSPTRIEPFEAIRTGLPSSAAQQHAPAASSPLSRFKYGAFFVDGLTSRSVVSQLPKIRDSRIPDTRGHFTSRCPHWITATPDHHKRWDHN